MSLHYELISSFLISLTVSLNIHSIDIYIYIYSHTKDSELVIDARLINIQHYKVRNKGKVKQSRERSNVPLHSGVVAIEKRAFESSSTTVTNFTFKYIYVYIYIYIYIYIYTNVYTYIYILLH